MPELLTRKELAKLLKISEKTIDRLREGRKIPFCKVGRSIRFNKKDVLEYLEQNKAGSIK